MEYCTQSRALNASEELVGAGTGKAVSSAIIRSISSKDKWANLSLN
jgi:K+-transporting ATPase A subunit